MADIPFKRSTLINNTRYSYIRFSDTNAKRKVMDEAELRVLGIEALDRALVPAEALRFLALFHHEPTDYVEDLQKAL
jgi:hypothetical protein